MSLDWKAARTAGCRIERLVRLVGDRAGGQDPHNRAPMPWERNNDQNEMLKHTKMLMLALPYFKSYVDASELRITGSNQGQR